MAFPLAMHIPRIPLLLASFVLYLTATTDDDFLSADYMLVAEGALQVAENCYCSGFLLHKVSQLSQRVRRVSVDALRHATFTGLPVCTRRPR